MLAELKSKVDVEFEVEVEVEELKGSEAWSPKAM